MSDLSFSAAKDEDASLVADILTSATHYKLNHGDTVWGSEGWSEAEVQDSMAESTMFLIRQNDEVAGTVSLQWDDERNWGKQPPTAGYIHRLAVKDGFHGQGLGERVIDWASAQAAANGRSVLRLDCEAKNTKLCHYYENLGFVRVGTRPVPAYDDYVAALYERPVQLNY